ncbi:zinc finger, CCHC-type containing protein [Tanacetum coccineum]
MRNKQWCSSSNKKPKLECWKCGKTCHFKRDCRSGKKNNANAGGSGKGSKDQSQRPKVDAIAWWIDSGATTHVCKDRCWFKTFKPVEDGSVPLHGVYGNILPPILEKEAVELREFWGGSHVANGFFKRKMKVDGTIDKFKARLVIQGFRQKEGIDYFDTYAAVARITTIGLLLALAAIHNLVIHQMDVKTAFLNGDLDEEVYMKQPERFIMSGNKHKENWQEVDREDCSSVSTPMDPVEKLKPNTGKTCADIKGHNIPRAIGVNIPIKTEAVVKVKARNQKGWKRVCCRQGQGERLKGRVNYKGIRM